MVTTGCARRDVRTPALGYSRHDGASGVAKTVDPKRLDRRLGAFVAVIAALLCANNLLPYVGGRDDSCQTMFSGLHWKATENNHLFMPQRALFDSWEYVRGVEAELEPPRPRDPRIGELAAWLNRRDRQINVDALRAVLYQICGAGHRVRLRWIDARNVRRETDDACGDEALSSPCWAIPVRLYETDGPAPPEGPS